MWDVKHYKESHTILVNHNTIQFNNNIYGVTMCLPNKLRKVRGISVCLLFFFMITRHCLTIMNPPDIVYEL
jgi:hypothetical protein